jgi:hypothetical protein
VTGDETTPPPLVPVPRGGDHAEMVERRFIPELDDVD